MFICKERHTQKKKEKKATEMGGPMQRKKKKKKLKKKSQENETHASEEYRCFSDKVAKSDTEFKNLS